MKNKLLTTISITTLFSVSLYGIEGVPLADKSNYDITKDKSPDAKYYVDARKLKVKPSGVFLKDGVAYTTFTIPFKDKPQLMKPSQNVANTNSTAPLNKVKEPIKEVDLTKEVKPIIVKTKNTEQSKYFLGVALGFTHLDTSYNKVNGAFSPVNSSDKNGYNFGWEVGYNIDENSFTTLSYNQINLDDAKLYNYLLSYNRRLADLPYNTYVGVLGGISYIETTKSPVANLNNTDAKGKTNILGVQVGSEYKIQKDLNFFAQYQFLKVKHTTNIVSGTAKATVQRDNISNLMFGIRWNFNSFGM